MSLVHLIEKYSPCDDAIEYCEKYDDPQQAWDECTNPAFLLFLLREQGYDLSELLPKFMTPDTIAYIRELEPGQRYNFIAYQHKTDLCPLIRSFFPHPPLEPFHVSQD